MAKTSTLNMLIDLARNDTDEAARQLAQLSKERQEAEQQLDALHGYRKDYAERLQQVSQSGLTASNYHNFRQFIATLDEAISQQNKIVAQLDQKLEQGKQRWFDHKRQLTSYETLLSRQEQERIQRDNRKEQIMTDELSSNQFRRHHNTH